ncbi:MAG TPA: hypothetical protein VMM12_03690 [Longimicrobiales bacterium]|nr:hypothetical protein [Longimicrobiales bacterium]
MGKKKPENGARRRGGKKRGPSRRPEVNRDATHNRLVSGAPSASSRLLLTRLLRDGAVWDVFIATTSSAGTPNVIRMEFEHGSAGRDIVRYSRAVEGPLLDALHSGTSLSRADLEQELEEAIREATSEDREPPIGA